MTTLSQLLEKTRELLFKPKILTLEDLDRFIGHEVARETGRLVFKYVLKRLGKIHYRLSSNDAYAEEIVSCQVKVHAELLGDYCAMLLKVIGMPSQFVNDNPVMQQLMRDVHSKYVATSPQGITMTSALMDEHGYRNNNQLRDMANATAQKLFAILPMTDSLRETDVDIFKGQVRLLYVDMLQRLHKRLDKECIEALFKH